MFLFRVQLVEYPHYVKLSGADASISWTCISAHKRINWFREWRGTSLQNGDYRKEFFTARFLFTVRVWLAYFMTLMESLDVILTRSSHVSLAYQQVTTTGNYVKSSCLDWFVTAMLRFLCAFSSDLLAQRSYFVATRHVHFCRHTLTDVRETNECRDVEWRDFSIRIAFL